MTDLTDKDVWVFIEHNNGRIADVSLELLGQGSKLAAELKAELCAVILGEKIEEISKEVSKYGVQKTYLIDSPILKDHRADAFVPCLVHLAKKHKPLIWLFGATTFGKDLAGGMATLLETGLAADCAGLKIDTETKLRQTIPVFGGNIMAEIVCREHRPQIATVKPKVFPKPEQQVPKENQFIREDIPISEEKVRTKILEFIPPKGKINLSNAEIIVTVGRGLKKAEDFKLIEELAEILGGAVGASRPVVDLGWISYGHQVGQTGLTVKPKLYIAIGVSGAIQHSIGMRTSEIIVAVNNDSSAPIFGIADYGIVGDLFGVVPALIQEIKKRKTV